MKAWQNTIAFMKLFTASLLSTVSALLLGCVSYERGLVLEPVGPATIQSTARSTTGSLVVYSAFDVHADFTSTDPDRHRHTDYKIFSTDGSLLQVVHNDTHSLLEGPAEVRLPAGAYRIAARATGFGLVTVPVIIISGRGTTVHLEGGYRSNKAAFAQTNTVRLPDGQIVGWRAAAEMIPPP